MTGRRRASAKTDVPPQIALDDRLCLALYAASRAMTARYRLELTDLGLTYPQYLVLVLLWEEGPASVSRIGGRLSLESNTLSPLLKRLETTGLITRSRASDDERMMIIGVTTAGRELEKSASPVLEEICEASGLALGEQADLVASLRALTAQLTSSSSQVTQRRRQAGYIVRD